MKGADVSREVERQAGPIEARQWIERGWSIGNPRKQAIGVMAAMMFLLGLVTIGITAWMVSGERQDTPGHANTRHETPRIEIWNVPARFPDRYETRSRDSIPAATAGHVEYRRCPACGRTE